MLETLLQKINEAGHVYEAGGTVRDGILGIPSKDKDYEVYGLHPEQLKEILSNFGNADMIGQSFQVFKLKIDGYDCDFSLPRRDSKVAEGHTGFKVEYDPFMSKIQACSRRDFTCNAMLKDTVTGEIFDFFGGQEDLEKGILRATSEKHFGDDPLRVLRGFGFSGRFDMKVEPKTAQLCQQLRYEYKTLSIDRIREEFFKWSLRSIKPSKGLEFLKDVGWISLYPELSNMIGCLQNPVCKNFR
jgi:tRNA nucleotidyltransferase (CCA-adding enzyme)